MKATGYCKSRARHYDTSVGRFLTKDLIEGNQTETQTLNRYIYALNEPIHRIDTNGNYSFSDFKADIGSLANGVGEGLTQEVIKYNVKGLL